MNIYEVKATPQAEMQMRNIAWYIAVKLENPDAADDLMDDFGDALEELGTNPERHPFVDEEPWTSEEIRWIKVKHYLMYFWIDVENATVQVTGIVYEKRDQKKFLGEMKLRD